MVPAFHGYWGPMVLISGHVDPICAVSQYHRYGYMMTCDGSARPSSAASTPDVAPRILEYSSGSVGVTVSAPAEFCASAASPVVAWLMSVLSTFEARARKRSCM